MVDGSLSLRNHLAVRNVLRADTDLRDEYAAVRRRVGAAAANLDKYGRGKSAMIQKILEVAGLTEAERASIDANHVPSHDEVPRYVAANAHDYRICRAPVRLGGADNAAGIYPWFSFWGSKYSPSS
ncbi:GrpB family protein [Dactylosporangium matsuzakiense]|uniref:Uncharacterized protein n=1 Tax=Dactylosporangium matsuzakiense TaxID=53360 RepID=A0A9W6KV37_9ACTN|nr:GrpB family protein [Dactylosporangium matsuzakiense]GLL08656.1 hypothetical protein GCM10017581_104230 [Dactylosporangium matsuzakiense]